MKPPKPRSLVQVHYHNRLSGVNKVIGLYAEAFNRLNGSRSAANLVVCCKSPQPNADFRPARVVSEPFCDYQAFHSKGQFERIKTYLIESLDRVLKSESIKPPVCVIGHNLSIGKNCALSAAFAEISRRFTDALGRFRFFSVIHDFAEEGRLDCLKQIDNVKKWADIESDLFPSDGIVQYITLNAGNADILKKAGFPAAVLYDPVERPFVSRSFLAPSLLVPPKREPKIAGANSHSPLLFKNDLPIILYPSRCISRKNILEAILLCNFIYKSNLMIGASGTDAKDRIAFNKAVALCKKYKLPVMFDYGRILSGKSEKNVFTNSAFDIADACVTTSIAEGFGYGLYEPWLYGKAVFGRKYLGFEPIAGVKFNGLYDCLPVPIDWLSFSVLREKYWESMKKCFGELMIYHSTPPPSRFPRRGNQTCPPSRELKSEQLLGKRKNNKLLSNRKKFDRTFSDYFIVDDSIDFGCLDISTQFAIVESLLISPRKLEEWEKTCDVQLSQIRKSAESALYDSAKVIHFNRNRIKEKLSIKSFSKEFGKILSQNPPKKVKTGRREEILREFCTFDRFRLLLAK